MLTVSRFARSCGLSRSTVLYYESIGLLRKAARSGSNYRGYTEKDLERLRQICVYRNAGLPLADIRRLLDRAETDAAAVLKRRLAEIDQEIEKLREHQRAIVLLLKHKHSLKGGNVITKEKWVAIMRASGFGDEDMHRWHREFEKAAPEEHQEFLEFLHIPGDEVSTIREWSRTPAK